MCKTGESNATRNLTKLVVVIDSLTTLRLKRTFQYLPDPTFDISNETLKAIERLVLFNLECTMRYISDRKH